MNRACKSIYAKLHGQNIHASSIRPLKNNFVRMKLFFFVSLILVILVYSCDKIQSYPPEPVLTYKSHKVTKSYDGLDNLNTDVSFTFEYCDGDGDLIVSYADSASIYSHLYIYLYEKQNGAYKSIASDTILFWLQYAEFMNRDGLNKTFKGSMTYNHIFDKNNTYDTIKFEWYVIDYELHKSNTLEIVDIPLKSR
jgi:hypothetical protein